MQCTTEEAADMRINTALVAKCLGGCSLMSLVHTFSDLTGAASII